MNSSVFHNWVPKWSRDVNIFILLCSQILVSGISSYSILSITAYLGDEKDFIQFAYYGGSIAGAAIFPVITRFQRYFRQKKLLLTGITAEIVLSVLAPLIINDNLLFMNNFLLSSVKIICLMDCISIFLARFNPTNSRGLLYGMYYGLSYPITQVSTYITAVILLQHPWKYTFIVSLPGLCLSWLIVRFLMHGKRKARKYPLYQVDWIGYALVVLAGLSLSYGCIYGERLRWLESNEIKTAFTIAVIAILMWAVRMLSAKRPYVDLRVLQKYSHALLGVSMMILLFFIYNTFSISTEFMRTVLGYDNKYTATSNLFMAVAYAVCIPLTGIWLHRRHKARGPLFLGFSLFALYYFITAHILYPEENTNAFFIPMMLSAAAFGITITSLSYYASVNIPVQDNRSRAFFSISFRSVLAAPFSSAFWLDRYNQAKQNHYTYISAQYTPDDPRFQSLWQGMLKSLSSSGHDAATAPGLAAASVHAGIYKQSIILAAQDIYYVLAAVSLCVAIAVLFFKVFNVHYEKAKNQYSLTTFKG
ncbi:hypothetical protein A8C56_17640 [Niabella ginsenosidivorans]|uniref:MFS transporter n=1 Tax=Niabella ginsenosidivorans TaxID=1176587 RepID=A0A1A9I5E8_9BACT|nr:MFS transporter [Niabella ginsenosidivorans]ANH82555.1 hypothetical protein A8C56_17640 [Niabella ginsenosidivorans]